MTSTPVVLAKPSGITLVEHTSHLREQFRNYILPARSFVISKYARRTSGKDLSALTLKAIQWHDAGKKHPNWQIPCQKDYQFWKAWHDDGRKGKEPRGVHLMHAGIRHEIASLARMLEQEPGVSPIIQTAVAAHHGKLSRYHRQRWLEDVKGDFKHLWKLFVSLSDEVDYVADFDDAILRRYEYAGPRALLQLADHRASAEEDGNPLAGFSSFVYEFPQEWEKRGVQAIIADLWDEPLALLRAPTGAGKTDAALIWAKRQIEQGRADRLVIAMPTRFTANSLSISDPASMSQRGLYHSSAWYQRLKQVEGLSTQARKLIDPEQDMARLLETPITVTTLDHLCICLSGTREDHHSIFFNLAHSCVVIDEADFYDSFTQANVVILLRTLRLLDVPVLIMSATLPESFRALYDAPKVYEDRTDSQRVRCHLKRCDTPVIRPSDVASLLQPALDGKPTIVYANTVQRAQRYYKWFIRNGVSPDKVILYHSRFAEPDKVAIEERLRKMLGKDAWETGTAYGIAILTQIGELSVNISVDYMLSELCPLDRLVQRVGRLARFSEQSGELHLLLPYKKSKDGEALPYPAPYGSYVSGTGWKALPALVETKELLQDGNYSADDFVRLVNKVYPKMPEMASHVQRNQRMLQEMVGMNWLLQPGERVAEEADQTKDWRCRDIDPQVTVLVGMGSFGQFDDYEEREWLRNRRDWRQLLLEHGVTCQTYEFNRAKEKGYLEEKIFAIGDETNGEKETAWLVRPAFYKQDLGLCFEDPEDEDE